MTEKVDGQIRIRENPPALTHVDDPRRFDMVHEIFDLYHDARSGGSSA